MVLLLFLSKDEMNNLTKFYTNNYGYTCYPQIPFPITLIRTQLKNTTMKALAVVFGFGFGYLFI